MTLEGYGTRLWHSYAVTSSLCLVRFGLSWACRVRSTTPGIDIVEMHRLDEDRYGNKISPPSLASMTGCENFVGSYSSRIVFVLQSRARMSMVGADIPRSRWICIIVPRVFACVARTLDRLLPVVQPLIYRVKISDLELIQLKIRFENDLIDNQAYQEVGFCINNPFAIASIFHALCLQLATTTSTRRGQ